MATILVAFGSWLVPTAARAGCPLGLPPLVELEWRVTHDTGRVETWWEAFGYVGLRAGSSWWRSVFRGEDGATRLVNDYVCSRGQLLLVGRQDRVDGVRIWFEPGIPVLWDEPGASSGLLSGVVETGRSGAATAEGTYVASVVAGRRVAIAVPAGAFLTRRTRVAIRGDPSSDEPDAWEEITFWWLEAAERFPVRAAFERFGADPGGIRLELVASRRLSVDPASALETERSGAEWVVLDGDGSTDGAHRK